MRTKSAGLFLIAMTMGVLAACGSDEPAAGNGGAEEPKQQRDANLPSNILASGVSVKDVAVFQGVKVPVIENGDLYTGPMTAPVVANRKGIIRVYVATEPGFKPQKVTAELRLVTADGVDLPTIRESKTISKSSTEESADSTFNLEFPGSSLPEGVSFQVWLTSEEGDAVEDTVVSPARYPQDGTLWQDVGAERSGKLRVVMVPVAYKADGSGRTPPTDAAQMALYHDTLMARYPASEVELTVREPLEYDAVIDGRSGQSFSRILSTIRELRMADKVDEDVYYYGIFTPTKSFQTFCVGGCIAGLSTLAQAPEQAMLRASVGVGYPGEDAADTFAHEVGHAHGREHAPCGDPQGVDKKWPKSEAYGNAALGAWGYNIFTKEFLAPEKSHDMMAYCPNEWVSDYTYNALFKRIRSLSKYQEPAPLAQVLGGSLTEGDGYAVAAIDGDGNAQWEPDTFRPVSGGVEKKAVMFGARGETLRSTTAQFFPYDHIPGGLLFVPKKANETFKSVALEGYTQKLAH